MLVKGGISAPEDGLGRYPFWGLVLHKVDS
jgi:hypothetical protein